MLLVALLRQGILAGSVEALVEHVADADIPQAHVLIRLVPTFSAILQAYQSRAAQCGQSFEHMVLLEAVVQDWRVSALRVFLLKPEHACTCG